MDQATRRPLGLLELSERLKLPAPWLKAEAGAGRIPHLRVGRRLLFDIDAVERELADRAAAGGEQQSGTEGER